MILIRVMLSTKERIIAAVTLRAVGDAAGISQSAPYRHFADKRALLDAMVRQIIEQLRETVDQARSEAASPAAALNKVVEQYYQFARKYPVRYRLLLEESRADNAVGAEARQAFSAVADLVHDAQKSGQIREGDPQQIVALIFGAVHGMADLEQFGLVKVAADGQSAAALPALLVEMLSRQAPEAA